MAHLPGRMYVPLDTFSSHGFALKTVVDQTLAVLALRPKSLQRY